MFKPNLGVTLKSNHPYELRRLGWTMSQVKRSVVYPCKIIHGTFYKQRNAQGLYIPTVSALTQASRSSTTLFVLKSRAIRPLVSSDASSFASIQGWRPLRSQMAKAFRERGKQRMHSRCPMGHGRFVHCVNCIDSCDMAMSDDPLPCCPLAQDSLPWPVKGLGFG